MKNLITGINGFAGSHLADRLVAAGEEVAGLARDPTRNQNILQLRDRVRVLACDIRDAGAVRDVLASVRPDRIYHLAAMTFVPAAGKEWGIAYDTNFIATGHLLEAVKQLKLKARVLWVGSAEEYGAGYEGSLQETQPLQPVSLYGVSKAAADLLAGSYYEREGLDVVRARPFNHIGPRQDPRFVCSSFARQIAEIVNGAEPVIRTGNLESRRDFTDVRDVVRAYTAIMEKGQVGEVYNICSGELVSIQSILDQLVKIAGVKIRIATDPDRYRAEELKFLRGDAGRLHETTGWKPQIPLEQTLRDTLEYWKDRTA